jgi:hypothetical protein
MIDEICNEQALDPATNPLSFFGYRHRRSLEMPDYSLRRTPKVVSALLDEYFQFVLDSSSTSRAAMDIKYGHIHNFEAAWWPIFRRPFLFDYARGRGLKVIHLSRWNSLETVVSNMVAESRKVWHAIGKKGAAAPSDAITLDKQHLSRQIALLNEQKNAIFKWSRDLKCLSVLYEELVDPTHGRACRTRIAEFLESSPPEKFSSPYRKVTPPIQLMIRNWDEISNFCRESGLSQYLLGTPR